MEKIISSNPIKIFFDNLNNIKKVLAGTAISLGVLLLLIYYAFYANYAPTGIDLGSLTLACSLISLWAISIIAFLLIISFGASWWLNDLFSKDTLLHTWQEKYSTYYLIAYPIFSTIILLLIDNKNFSRMQETWLFNSIFIIIPCLFALYLSYIEINIKSWKNIYKIPLHAIFTKGYLSPLAFNVIVNLLIAWAITIKNQNSLYIIIWIIVIVFINILIISKKLTNKNILIIFPLYIVMVSSILSVFKVNNPIIILPFQHFKLGYYNEIWRFKSSYIQETNLWDMKDKNQTTTSVFVVSRIGDEYVFRKDENGTNYYINKDAIDYRLDLNLSEKVKK